MSQEQVERLGKWLHVNVAMFGKEPALGSHWLEVLMTGLFVGGLVWIFFSMTMSQSGSLPSFVRDLGVSVKRMGRAAREIERKTFHLTGLAVPAAHAIAIDYLRYTPEQFAQFAVGVTAASWAIDLSRLYGPKILRDNFPLQWLLREKERSQLCGACYFSLGATTAIVLFEPPIAMTSIVFLIFGDMMAALIGVSFGGETCVVKLGREGKKSLEGSVAMFFSCAFVGLVVFRGAPLAEQVPRSPLPQRRSYIVVVGALVATLVELFEPFGLNDNLTIPIFSCIALTWAIHRVENECGDFAALI